MSSHQISRRDERAAKVEDVYKCIQENFISFGEFLEELLTNETLDVKNKAGRFYQFHETEYNARRQLSGYDYLPCRIVILEPLNAAINLNPLKEPLQRPN